jgi:hypothetical protein
MTPHDKERDEPTQADLDAAEEVFADSAQRGEPGIYREVVEAHRAFATGDWTLEELFHKRSAHVQYGWSLAYAAIRWRNYSGHTTKVIQFWAPRGLFSEQELAEVDTETLLEPKLKERGVPDGAVRVRETFALGIPDERERQLLELESPEPIMRVFREYFDAQGEGLLLERTLLRHGEVTGHVRFLPQADRSLYEW